MEVDSGIKEKKEEMAVEEEKGKEKEKESVEEGEKEDFNDDEYEIAKKVLRVLSADVPRLRQPKYKELRKLGMCFLQGFENKIFLGQNPEKFHQDKIQRKQRKSRLKALKKMDIKARNSSQIRQQRFDALAALTAPPTTALTFEGGQGGEAREGEEVGFGGGLVEGKKRKEREGEEGKNKEGEGSPSEKRPKLERNEPSSSSSSSSSLVPTPPKETPREYNCPVSCYICKFPFLKRHHFYDALCPKCASLNFQKRHQTSDLGGHIMLLTGGRIKIGFQSGLKLLRAGAFLIVSTRFPNDAYDRYKAAPDFAEWKDRLRIYGLDLRDLTAVEVFCHHLSTTYPYLTAIVHNAAQTVRRPTKYYESLIKKEKERKDSLPFEKKEGEEGEECLQGFDPHKRLRQLDTSSATSSLGAGEMMTSALMSQIPVTKEDITGKKDPKMMTSGGIDPLLPLKNTKSDDMKVEEIKGEGEGKEGAELERHEEKGGVMSEETAEKLFPVGKTDPLNDNIQVDLRTENSWTFRLHEVSAIEAVEVHCINALAPFVINGKLKPMMMRAPEKYSKYIVNVSAMEGKFYRKKTDKHPHTNMAKASMNMMTRTSSGDYAASGIYMNSVDTGWISDEKPWEKAQEAFDRGWQTPIDEIDAAARILDLIFVGENEKKYPFGKFMKDYKESEW